MDSKNVSSTIRITILSVVILTLGTSMKTSVSDAKWPEYNAALDISRDLGGGCGCSGVFTSCIKTCSAGDCNCTCGWFSCVCSSCEQQVEANNGPVSISKEQYANVTILGRILEKSPDLASQDAFQSLAKMISLLTERNYARYHKEAVKFEKTLLKELPGHVKSEISSSLPVLTLSI